MSKYTQQLFQIDQDNRICQGCGIGTHLYPISTKNAKPWLTTLVLKKYSAFLSEICTTGNFEPTKSGQICGCGQLDQEFVPSKEGEYLDISHLFFNKLYLVNTSILTNVGKYEVFKISTEVVNFLISINEGCFTSAIGHKGTAEVVSSLLDYNVNENRITLKQEKGDAIIAFKLKQRLPEGVVLDKQSLEGLDFEFWLIKSV